MSETTLRRILALLALLALGYGASLLVGDAGEADGAEGPVADALRRAAAAELDSIRIVGDGDTVALRRGTDGWRVNGHRADTVELAALRRALEGASAELASRNPENHADMGVDSAGARRLTLWPREGEAVKLLLGGRGPYAASVHARVPGTSPVHLVRGELGRIAGREAGGWRDRTLVALDTARTGAIAVRRADAAYRLRRADGGWRIGEAPADTARVRELLGLLADLEATGFAPDTAAVKPAERAVVALGRGAGDTLARLRLRRTGPEDRPRYRVAVDGRDAVFVLTGARADRLTPPPGELQAGGGPEERREGASEEASGAP